MLAHLLDVSLRSLALALAGALVLWILRRRRTAALEHAVWTAVVCGMLALFGFGPTLPRLALRVAATPAAPAQSVPSGIFEPASAGAPSAPASSSPARSLDWSGLALLVYGAVALALLAQFATGAVLAARLVADAREAPGFRESERITVPLTVGWLGPEILLPAGWRQWDLEKLDAVLAHEGEHVRRRDGLIAALAALNRSLFWFHPLAWMLERRISLAAEQACDESCVALLGDRDRYARLLLEMARTVDASRGRLRCHALTMAASSHIACRIAALLREGRTFSRGLTRAGYAAIALCGIPLVWGAGAVELDREQVPAAVPAPAPATQKFEAASVKLCTDDAGPAGRRGGGNGDALAGRLQLNCQSVRNLIREAYMLYGGRDNPKTNPNIPLLPIEGGPEWTASDRYSIEAKAEGPATQDALRGPMLRALLEDRFQLRIHRETRQVPMYELVVAKGGPKPHPFVEGSCDPWESATGLREPGEKPICKLVGGGIRRPRTEEHATDFYGMTLDDFAQALMMGRIDDRPILNKTGLRGKFDFHFTVARKVPGDDATDAPGPTIFEALEHDLGLKLVPARGPGDTWVIDHVERPSAN